MNIYVYNIINSILSIRTYIKTTTLFYPIILLTLLYVLLLRRYQILNVTITSWVYLAIIRLARITVVSFIMWSALSSPVAILISTKSMFILCSISNINSFDMEQLNKIFACLLPFITSPPEDNRIYS